MSYQFPITYRVPDPHAFTPFANSKIHPGCVRCGYRKYGPSHIFHAAAQAAAWPYSYLMY